MQKAERALLGRRDCAKALRLEDLFILEELEEDRCGWSVVSKREKGA